ncbi:MAG: hypothetical protein LBD23_09315 [Oscillospiraceae bacterium]|jgi:hypothetical protein|nr:hypothetical protein [Oscillospiraceae bacterium]
MNMDTINRTNVDYMLKKSLQRSEIPSDELLTKIKYNRAKDRPALRAYYHGRRLAAAATVAVTLLALSTVAIATNLFGLRNMELPTPQPGDQFLGIPITEEMLDDPEYSWLLRQDLSMQGYEGSPEHAAAAEWRAFVYGYDTDGTLKEAAGNTWGDVPEPYQYYGAYTMEMVEKIREIINKHGLTLIGDLVDTRTSEELHSIIAKEAFFKDDSIWSVGSVYESGTFVLEGEYNEAPFYMRSSRKGVFDWVYMSGFDENSDYDEWVYENAFGKQLILVQGDYGSIIILDTETAFNVIIVYAGTQGCDMWTTDVPPFTRSDLEHFANLIDFEQLRTEPPDTMLISIIEEQRNVMNVAVSSLFGKWDLWGMDQSPILPAWNIDNPIFLTINDDRTFTLWRGEDLTDPQSWEVKGEIVADNDNYKAIAYSWIHYEGTDFSIDDMTEMQLQYDLESRFLRLMVGENKDSLIFVKS